MLVRADRILLLDRHAADRIEVGHRPAPVGAIERLDDRALERRAVAQQWTRWASACLHRLQLGDLPFDLPNPRSGDGADATAIAALVVAQPQQLFDLVEREAEILGALDEAHDPHRVVRELAVARRPTRRLGSSPRRS